MKLSIIIPAYNAEKTIEKCLTSIYQQDVAPDDYEVIVVNDCSTDLTLDIVSNLKFKFTPPPKIINLKHNSRQGAARNIGVKEARGKYVQYLDADDFLVGGSLKQLMEEAETNDCDIIMFDSETVTEDGRCVESNHYRNNPSIPLSGEEYLNKCEVPWEPWLSLIRKTFLMEKGIKFAEGVRFEDTDYMLKSYLLARSTVYRPITVVSHVINPESTVHIGNDISKVREQMMTFERLFKTIDVYESSYPLGVNALKHHYTFVYNAFITRTLWRYSYGKIVSLLKQYPYRLDTHCIGKAASSHPYIYGGISQIIGPFLLSAVKLRNKLRRR